MEVSGAAQRSVYEDARTSARASSGPVQPRIFRSFPSKATAARKNCSSSRRTRSPTSKTLRTDSHRGALIGKAASRSFRSRAFDLTLVCSTRRRPIGRQDITMPG